MNTEILLLKIKDKTTIEQYLELVTFKENNVVNDEYIDKLIKNVIKKHISNISNLYYKLMLNDTYRNNVFRNVIDKYVTNDSIVLDAGSGIGILSMFASKKTKHIFAVEKDPITCDLSKKILNDNNINLKIINKSILDLDSNDFNNKKPNILICELVGDYFIKEGIIPYIKHIKTNLLSHNSIIMPCGGNIYARLLSSKDIENHICVNKYIDEFNINRFKMLTIEEGCCNISNSLLNNNPYQFLSDEILIYNFDFYNDNIQLNNKTCKLTANKDGKCIGVLIYFDILVDEDNIINIIEKNENMHWESRLFRTLDLNKEINKNDVFEFDIIVEDNIKCYLKKNNTLYSL